MKKSMSSFLKRILAVALAMFMVFTSMPLPVVTYAETSGDGSSGSGGEVTGNNKAVTVTIQETGETVVEQYTLDITVTGGTANMTIGDASVEWVEKEGNQTGTYTVDANPAVPYTITADSGYYIKDITVDGNSILDEDMATDYRNSVDLSTQNRALIVELGTYYTVNATVLTNGDEGETGGRITYKDTDVNQLKVDSDASVLIAVESIGEYVITSIKMNDEDIKITNQNSQTIEVSRGDTDVVEIEVIFTKMYTVTINYDSAQGIVTTTPCGENNVVTQLRGEQVQFSAQPTTGYTVSSVIINGEPVTDLEVGNNKTYTTVLDATQNYVVEISFALNQYQVSSTEIEGGVVTIANSGIVNYDATANVTITVEEGYVIDTIKVTDEDGTIDVLSSEVSPAVDETGAEIKNSFCFDIENVQKNKTIEVTYSETAEADVETVCSTINSDYLRLEDNVFIIKSGGNVTFETTLSGLKIYTDNENVVYESDDQNSIVITTDTVITDVWAYYKVDTGEYAAWHKVTDITRENPWKVIVDASAPVIKEPVLTPSNENGYVNGYYNCNINIDLTVADNGDYSGIDSIKYFITKDEIAEGTSYADALMASNTEEECLYTYSSVEGSDILQSITLSELETDKSIDVSSIDYNSQYTKVWIKVTDRAGLSTEKVIPLQINSTSPEVTFTYDGKKCKDENNVEVNGYYYNARTITVTVVDRADTFLADDLKTAVKSIITKDENPISFDGNDVVWEEIETSDANTKIYKITFNEGLYVIDIDNFIYTNKAGLKETNISVPENTKDMETFIVDRILPTVDSVTYPVDAQNSTDDRYYNEYVDVTVSVSDNLSGIKEIRWKYIKAENASDINEDSDQNWNVIPCTESTLTKTQMIRIPKDYVNNSDEKKQFNGYLEIRVVDKADHVSVVRVENDKVFVVDTRLPIGTVTYTQQVNTIGTQKVYDKTNTNGKIEFTIDINEANFDSNDINVMVSKDGQEAERVNATWQDISVDIHRGTYVISGDGDYVLSLDYTDKSGNAMESYTTDKLTIDTISPVVDFAYDKSAQSMTFTVTEHNFRAQDISLSGTITDIYGNAIENYSVAQLENMLRSANWKAKGNDVYTCSLESCPDGIYDLSIDYKDIALQDAATVNTGNFIIDHTAPTNVKIDYSKSLLDTILETITFGFYKGDVKVTFTAYDQTAGVASFTWNYTKESGVSDINRTTDAGTTTVVAVQDASDKSKFTATITLPDTDVKQLRGYIAVVASDKMAVPNVSAKVTDSGHVIVVDSVAPTMTAEYSAADRIVGTTSYYNDKAEVTFTVTEANFYAEDVVVMVSKDGGTAYAITPKWTDVNADTHVGTYTLSGDGDYVITVDYTDRSTNKMATYVSNVITIDTIQPVVDVVYENKDVINTLTDRDGMNRQYFAKTQTATVTITEHNFNASDVVFNIKATDVTGKELDVNSLYTKSEWKVGDKADTYVCTITYPGDANYTFDVEYADLATNSIADYAPNYFTVDNTAPVDLKVSYSTSILETVLEALSFGFYNAKTDVTITADDAVSGVQAFMYSYTKADGVSAVNAELINQAIAASELVYSADGKTATVHFQIPKDVLTTGNQFNGTISFEATDRAGYKNTLSDSKRIVVDNIAPTASVTYNEPVNREGTISYYDGNVNATVVITEANFYAQDVVVTASIDGGASYAVTPSWVNNSVDTHTGTFTLSEDGDYFITISYRDKSSNEMVVYTSEQLTIDTDIQEPTITFNGNNEDRMAYKGEIIPEISFTDVNYDSFEIFLYRTSMDAIDVDITEEKGINNLFSITDETGSASLNIFDVGEDGKYDPNDDGIYRLLVTMQDKAGHTIEKEAYFTINRYGSVYAFNDYLVNLIADGGAYVNAVNEDLVITEYNADRLVSDSLNIEITRDGKPLDSAEYTVSPTISDGVSVGSSGWYQYEYVISKNNFGIDGIYKIYVSSTDATGNNPENSNFEDKNILFYVDSTAPEITSITGLDKSVVDATELTISYTVFDAIGLKSVKVYVDGEVLQEVTDFTADYNNYAGSFTLEESEKEREIRVVVEDMAGNITDTASEDFTSAYAFNDGVTVTTNALVRFYANKPLFYGTIGGTAGVAGLAGFGIRRFRLRKKIK